MKCTVSVSLFIILFPLGCNAQPDLFHALTYRNFSPTRVSAWISDIAVPENPDSANLYTFYTAARHGGVWKTTNNGVSFEPITDGLPTTSIGAIEVAPSNPNVIWVGTGEASNARSAHAGKGVYKSTNAGRTFQFMGLERTQHIPKIIIHPREEDIVYVASMGSLFSPNEDRGVFRTMDGGETWEKVFYINENVGVIDMVINRQNPQVLYIAAYEKYRYPWHVEAGGPESGIYKSTDGGKSWHRLGGGLPEGNLGRIGIDLFRSDPDIVYAVVENLNPRPGCEEQAETAEYNHLRDPYFDRLIGGEVYRSSDGGANWVKMNRDTVDVGSKAAYSFNQILVDPLDDHYLYINSIALQSSTDRGKTWDGIPWEQRERFHTMFGDVRTLWIDPNDPRHIMAGSDGGLNVSWDRGQTTLCYDQIPLGEVYNIEADDAIPYHIYAGLQDHEGWKVPSNGWMGSVGDDDWVLVGMWDGMYLKVDHENNRWLYTTTQFGAHQRVDQLLGERVGIQPRAPEGMPPYRFTWNTPLIVSPHNSRILYTGGQMLLRSVDRGDHWHEISPDLTRNDPEKIAGRGHIMYCTISSISESPIRAGIIWVGTDDGKVWITQDFGKQWSDLSVPLLRAGAPDERFVSRIFASHHEEGRGYVVKSGFRNDDFSPYIYRTDDYGQTWTAIAANLPDQPVSAFWADDTNPDLLFIGNDHGVYFTFDGGNRWIPLRNNMPPVPVKDLLIHPKARDLIVGTYGRGVFVTDIFPFLELSEDLLNKEVHLFNMASVPQRNYSEQAGWGNHGPFADNLYRTPNEDNGLPIYYYLKEDRQDTVRVWIRNRKGELMAELEGDHTAGIHRIIWDTAEVDPGEYAVTLCSGGFNLEKKAIVLERWLWPVGNKANRAE
jgi:photosystem II stability/assembly factor-like uncharacterized protein